MLIAKKNEQILQMENVDVELGRNADVVQNTVQSLLDCVEKNKNFTNKVSPSIYKAPSTLRNLSPISFDPRVVSIGPLHSKDENVQPFEGRKASFIHNLLKRVESQKKQTLEACVRRCVQKVAASIEQIKGCYAGVMAYDDTKLAKMMVMDACFILEFIYWLKESDEATHQLNMLLAQSIIYDLVLLENQIPFFVLNDIFLCTVKNFEPKTSLIEFILPVLNFFNLFEARIKISNIRINTTTTHILGLLHQCYQPRYYTLSYFSSSSTIHSAVELDRAGVNFKPNRDANWPTAMEMKLSWFLGKPTIKMSVLRVHHFTELVFRNIIAYEQSSLDSYNNYVTSYAIAMDMLIDTQEDVARLVKSKVLVNNMGSNEEAANMMNNICKEVVRVRRHNKDWKKLDTYCNDFWPKNIARLRRTYFSNPWSIIALVAGMVLFALTVIQTFFTIKPPGNRN